MSLKHVTFVDDDPKEIEDFRRLFGGQFDVTAVTVRSVESALDQIRQALAGRLPDLFVLDMFLPAREGAPTDLGQTDREAGQRNLSTLARRLDALPKHFADGKTLLRETYGVIADLTALLRRWCERLDQSPDSGLALLRQLDAAFPGVPKLFYSRKASVEDARQALAAGAADVIPKLSTAQADILAPSVAEAFLHRCRT